MLLKKLNKNIINLITNKKYNIIISQDILNISEKTLPENLLNTKQ